MTMIFLYNRDIIIEGAIFGASQHQSDCVFVPELTGSGTSHTHNDDGEGEKHET